MWSTAISILMATKLSAQHVTAQSSAACGTSYTYSAMTCPPLQGAIQSPDRQACYAVLDSLSSTDVTFGEDFSRYEAATLCSTVGGLNGMIGGLARASSPGEWRAMERACGWTPHWSVWTGLRALGPEDGSIGASGRPTLAWQANPVRTSERAPGLDNEGGSALPYANVSFASSLVTRPDWTSSQCDCSWDYGHPKPLPMDEKDAERQGCVHWYKNRHTCESEHHRCRPNALDRPTSRNGGMYLRTAGCSTDLPAVCCEFIHATDELEANDTKTVTRNNTPPHFRGATSWKTHPEFYDVRIADAWPNGTQVLPSLPVADNDDEASIADSPFVGAPSALVGHLAGAVTLRLVPGVSGVANPVAYLDAARARFFSRATPHQGRARILFNCKLWMDWAARATRPSPSECQSCHRIAWCVRHLV